MFSRWSQAGTVERSDLDEVVRVRQHVLQPGLIHSGWNKYAVRPRLRVVVLPPVFYLVERNVLKHGYAKLKVNYYSCY